MLEIIIQWLQVSATECNRQTLRLKIRFVSRDLVPNGRATCTIASRVNFFYTKHSVKVDGRASHQIALAQTFFLYVINIVQPNPVDDIEIPLQFVHIDGAAELHGSTVWTYSSLGFFYGGGIKFLIGEGDFT